MMKKNIMVMTVGLMLLAAQPVFAHCQVPCGIFDDEMRAKMVEEHIVTIEKAMNEINETMANVEDLAYDGALKVNQMVRWIETKDEAADAIGEIVTSYFMAQRLKPVEGDDAAAKEKYVTQLTLLHEMLLASVAAKQSTDLAVVEKMRTIGAALLASAAAEAAPAVSLSPEEQIKKEGEELIAALFAGDKEKILSFVSEEFSHYEVPDKKTLADFLQMGIDMGYLDNLKDQGGEIDYSEAELSFDGDKVTIYPIEAMSDMGSVTVEVTLKKEADGVYRLITADVEGI
ncbi:MAG: nickel superoxide dismutase [Candidatus Hydrogenedentes bacterium]|nr:nickel superoxide dismutase [Candidatus Hydrogenedentota bacterium]